MKQGDIVLLEFPFSNLTEKKVRPAVILSNDSYNTYANVLMAGIYGKAQPLSIRITNQDLFYERMRKAASHVSLQNILSVEKVLIRQQIDALTPLKLKQVLAAFEQHIR